VKMREAEKLSKKITELEELEQNFRDKVNYLLIRLPNIMHETVPNGKDENDNVEVKVWGKIPVFGFKPKDHIELMSDLDLADLERAAR